MSGFLGEYRLVIPAFNEAQNLEPLVSRIDEALKGRRWRVFIVDDGSKDETASVSENLAKRYPVSLIRHGSNRGIAAVFLTGLSAAADGAGESDVIAVLEGDGTSDPALLPSLADAVASGADAAIASRHVQGGAYRRFPLKRLFLSVAANWILRILCPIPGVRDYTIFYRVYRAGPLKRALAEHGRKMTSVGGFACNAELLLRLKPFIGAVAERPFIYDYGIKRGASSMRIGGNIFSYLALFRVYFFELSEQK